MNEKCGTCVFMDRSEESLVRIRTAFDMSDERVRAFVGEDLGLCLKRPSTAVTAESRQCQEYKAK